MNHLPMLFDLIGELSRSRYQLAEHRFAHLGFNHTEARLLTLLDKEGGTATQEILSGMLSIDRSNAGRALKSLEQRMLIVRTQDTVDKRTKLIQITTSGNQAVMAISALKKEMIQTFLGQLDEDEVNLLIPLLKKILATE